MNKKNCGHPFETAWITVRYGCYPLRVTLCKNGKSGEVKFSQVTVTKMGFSQHFVRVHVFPLSFSGFGWQQNSQGMVNLTWLNPILVTVTWLNLTFRFYWGWQHNNSSGGGRFFFLIPLVFSLCPHSHQMVLMFCVIENVKQEVKCMTYLVITHSSSSPLPCLPPSSPPFSPDWYLLEGIGSLWCDSPPCLL